MLRTRTLPLLLVAMPFLAFVVGCAGTDLATDSDRPVIVAEYSGEVLTLEDFEAQYMRSTGSRTAAAEDSLAAYEDYLTRYVDFRLKVAEARRIGLDDDPEIRAEIEQYREQLAQPYLIEREVLEDIIRDLHAKQQEEVAAAHILLLIDQHAAAEDTLAAFQKLTAVRDSIVAGELSFEQAAVRHSEDPSALRNQGYLGYFSGGRMILAFEDMAYNTPVGGVSPVFRTQYGYHIIEVRDRRPASGEIRASHILIRLAPGASPEEVAAAEEQIALAQQRLEAGERFAAVATDLSQDPGSAQRGGDLGFFGADRMVPEFAEAAFALENVGDRSEVVQTQFGLHLIELTDRKDLPTYEENYDTLKRLAERLPRTQDRRQEVGRAYRDEVGSTIDEEVILRAVADQPADGALDHVRQHGFGEYSDAPFATIGETRYTLGDFENDLREIRVNPEPNQAAQLVRLLDGLLNERAIPLAASRLESRNPEFRRIMQDYHDGVLLFRLSEDSVWTAASRDTLGLQAHYDANAERYQFSERLRVLSFYSRSDSLLHVAGEMMSAGRAPADVVAALRGEDEQRPAVRLDTLMLSSRSGGLFDRAFDLEPGQHAEPSRYRGEWVMLYLDGIEEPRQMRFEEARAQVITEYQEVLEQRLVERLRREANARLYPERLQQAFMAERGGAQGTVSASATASE